MKKILAILGLMTLGAVLIYSCKKEQPELECDVTDPCSEQQVVSAEFTMEEITGVLGGASEQRTITDTSFANRNIRFYALEDNVSYHWTIGTEDIYEREVFRYFPDEFENSDIPIKLRVEKEPSLECFPEDDGLDSLTKILHIYEEYPGDDVYFGAGGGAEKYDGVYRMVDNLTGDSITVDIKKWEAFTDENEYPVHHFKITNLTPGGYDYFAYSDTIRSNGPSRITYRQARMAIGNSYAGISIYREMGGVTTLFFYPTPEIDGLTRRSFSGFKID